jgi:hypothetical protein
VSAEPAPPASGHPDAPYPTSGYPGQPTPTSGYPGQPTPTSGYPGQPTPTSGYPGQPTSGYPTPTSGYPGQPTAPVTGQFGANSFPQQAVQPYQSPADLLPPGPVIVQVGEIGVTSTVIHTPAGDIPLAGSNWQVHDYWHHEQRIPQWAIICAIAGFCILTVFSLLFLLAKETISRGTVQVTVTNGTRQYVARIPVTHQSQVGAIHHQINYIRSLAAL